MAAASAVTDGDVEDRFLCMMNAYSYWQLLDPKQAADARQCLVALTARVPDFAEGRAVLALLTLDQARGQDGTDRSASLDAAATLLRGAPDDDRLSLTARMALAACRGDVQATDTLAHALAAAAPNDPDSLADAADAAGLAALDWPFALALETTAIALARDPLPQYVHATAAKALIDGDDAGALRAMSRAPQRGNTLGQSMLFIIAGLADAPLRAQGAAAALAKLEPANRDAIRTTIARACWHPEVKTAFTRALKRLPDPNNPTQ